jgi:hypothetical protein
LVSLFQRNSNFNGVKDQCITISPLTKKLYLIGNKNLASGVNLSNITDIIDSIGCGLEKNWTIIALAEDEGCVLIAEEFQSGKYKVVFTNNLKLVIMCLNTLNDLLPISKKMSI